MWPATQKAAFAVWAQAGLESWCARMWRSRHIHESCHICECDLRLKKLLLLCEHRQDLSLDVRELHKEVVFLLLKYLHLLCSLLHANRVCEIEGVCVGESMRDMCVWERVFDVCELDQEVVCLLVKCFDVLCLLLHANSAWEIEGVCVGESIWDMCVWEGIWNVWALDKTGVCLLLKVFSRVVLAPAFK